MFTAVEYETMVIFGEIERTRQKQVMLISSHSALYKLRNWKGVFK